MSRRGRHAGFLYVLCIANLAGISAFVSAEPVRGAGADPRVSVAIRNAAGYLRNNIKKASGAKRNLAALALLLAGEPPNSPLITDSVKQIRSLIKDGKYEPRSEDEHIYGAGVNATLLADLDPAALRPELEAITNYVIASQGDDGSWDYPGGRRTVGDTSISQYGMLALWAGERAKIPIPPEVYQKIVAWHQKTQNKRGGFSYHPGTKAGYEQGAPTLTNSAAGTGSLLIARMFLRPNAPAGKWEQSSRPRKAADKSTPDRRKLGVLKKVDLDSGTLQTKKKQTGTAVAFDSTIERSLGWLRVNFRDRGSNPDHPMYYYYTLERMAALGNIRTLGSHDWYQECSNVVLPTQTKNGDFKIKSYSGPLVGTSLAILFLTKSTAKVLGRPVPGNIGTGLMAGGRGLPANLKTVRMKDGRVESPKKNAPFETLLAELDKPQSLDIAAAQKAIVEKVQLGDRKALIGQVARLKKLVDHPNADVRRTAIWALGRSSDLRLVPLLLKALEDSDVDVMIEARNALCWISRKPLGFGLSPSPFDGISEQAGKSQKDRAITKWRTEAVRRWRAWYLKIRRYEERDDLLDSVSRKR